MSDFNARVNELIGLIKNQEETLAANRKELAGLTSDLRDQLRMVNTLTGNKVSSLRVGRPKGSVPANGEMSVSQQVLAFVRERGATGAARAELLAIAPNREAAVNAAVRSHQVAKRIYNKDHRWYATGNIVTEEQPVEGEGTLFEVMEAVDESADFAPVE